MIAIIDYGLSNLLSIKRAVDFFEPNNCITNSPDDVVKADKIILPGVGAFHYGMECMDKKGLTKAVQVAAKNKIPILGICLGMQMLFEDSEEGGLRKGLGLISGHVLKIDSTDDCGRRQNVPHIGWEPLINNSQDTNWPNILEGISAGSEVYFVHSYHGVTNDIESKAASIKYGGRDICAIAQNNNIIGCQFHPEKSGKVGLHILSNFLKI